MPYLSTLIISFLATLSLASPVARQADCPPLGGSGNQNNFKLVAVSAEDSSDVSPLAIGSNVYPSPGDDTYLGVYTLFFFFAPLLPRADELYMERRLKALSQF